MCVASEQQERYISFSSFLLSPSCRPRQRPPPPPLTELATAPPSPVTPAAGHRPHVVRPPASRRRSRAAAPSAGQPTSTAATPGPSSKAGGHGAPPDPDNPKTLKIRRLHRHPGRRRPRRRPLHPPTTSPGHPSPSPARRRRFASPGARLKTGSAYTRRIRNSLKTRPAYPSTCTLHAYSYFGPPFFNITSSFGLICQSVLPMMNWIHENEF